MGRWKGGGGACDVAVPARALRSAGQVSWGGRCGGAEGCVWKRSGERGRANMQAVTGSERTTTPVGREYRCKVL